MIDCSPWADVLLVRQITSGNRNEVWLGQLGDVPVAVRQSRRSAESLDWELDLMDSLERIGFRVPSVIAADDGRRSVDRVVVQRWLDGHEPSTDAQWRLVADELVRLHDETMDYPQRPDCSTVRDLSPTGRSVDADLSSVPVEIVDRLLAIFADFDDVSTSVVHGDPMAGNVRIGPDGAVGLLDWDESRVDLTWHDLSNLGVQVLDDENHRRALRLSNAWEAANGWILEPDYARRRLEMLTD